MIRWQTRSCRSRYKHLTFTDSGCLAKPKTKQSTDTVPLVCRRPMLPSHAGVRGNGSMQPAAYYRFPLFRHRCSADAHDQASSGDLPNSVAWGPGRPWAFGGRPGQARPGCYSRPAWAAWPPSVAGLQSPGPAGDR